MLGKYVDLTREKQPLIHNITNYVTVNDVANIILACGASPIMADEVDEVKNITAICGGLNINTGTLNHRTIESMMIAGDEAKRLNHVVLLDPVGAGASSLRTRTANLDQSIAFLKAFSKETGSIVAATGAIDLVCSADEAFVIRNGRAEMSRITGTGCQLSGLMTAFAAAAPESERLYAAAAAVCTMGVAGEIAYGHLAPYEGNATYCRRIIDAIYHMDGKTLDQEAEYERK